MAVLPDSSATPAASPCSRRIFLQSASGVAASLSAGGVLPQTAAATAPAIATKRAPALQACTLLVNGRLYPLQIEARVTLLDALRETIGLTGTKKGCDRGQCGACTVLVNGRRINSCLTLAVMQEGAEITTIEGLGTPDAMHPMQAAFVAHDALQCGFCTPGQVCSAVALLGELKAGTASAVTPDVRVMKLTVSDAEIRERMSGNLCRCGAYNNIVTAVRTGGAA